MHTTRLTIQKKEETRVGSRHGEIILLFYINSFQRVANRPIPGGISHHSHANSLTVKPFLHNSRRKTIMFEIMNFNSVKHNDVF